MKLYERYIRFVNNVTTTILNAQMIEIKSCKSSEIIESCKSLDFKPLVLQYMPKRLENMLDVSMAMEICTTSIMRLFCTLT
jgi:hypothetical protein